MNQNNIVYLERLFEEKYGKILCYPKFDLAELKKRVNELSKLGVETLELIGEKTVFNTPILGKGCVGIVVVAYTEKGKTALKIRRIDADRNEMQHEAEMLKKANTVEVGPKLFEVSENFLLMDFIKGSLFLQWISTLKGKRTKFKIQKVLRDILEQCWRLDNIGLDHGELSNAPKHIIIDNEDKPWIVDFETSSINRKVSNVTSICQYLFIGSEAAKAVKKRLGDIDRNELMESLRNYKRQRSRKNLEKILKVCDF